MTGSRSNLPAEFSVRPVQSGDGAIIARQRHRMFVDAGIADDADLQRKTQAFGEWLPPRLASGSYYGWLITHNDETVAGLGMMTLDWPPHPLHLEPNRAYILNVYVAAAYRGRGLARGLTEMALEEARRRGLLAVTLHASVHGKPLYERFGFEATNEMRLILPPL